MSQRFYQVKLRSRDAFCGDLGERLTMTGVVFEGEGVPVVVMTPFTSCEDETIREAPVIRPTDEEWSEIIQHSDDPKVFEIDESGGIKATHRKLRYAISGSVQQKVWARDGFKCMFCERMMGDVQLTVDHWIPLEQGGLNDPTNYLSACRKCNKRKGGLSPQDFCDQQGYDFAELQTYMESLKVPFLLKSQKQ